MEQTEQSLVVSVQRAAIMLDVSEAQIRLMLAQGQLKSIRAGRRTIKVTRFSIEALVNSAEVQTA